jgi:hypothetical protein
MKPIEFEGQTTLLGPPRGSERGTCGALPVVIHERSMASFWKPSPEDLVMLNNGAHICLEVHSHQHPPVWLSVQRVTELP